MAPEVAEKLSAMQALVIKFLTAPDEEIKASLTKMLPGVKVKRKELAKVKWE